MKLTAIFIALVTGVLAMTGDAYAQTTAPSSRPAPTAADRAAFAEAVDLTEFGMIAVHQDGRIKTFETFAREMMSYVTGSRTIEDQSRTHTYLDLMLRPEAYQDAAVIYVKSKLLRSQMADALTRSMQLQLDAMRPAADDTGSFAQREAEIVDELEGRLEAFRQSGMISEPMLFDPAVTELLGRLETDVLRSAKFVRMIDTALAVKDPQLLRGRLRVVPPPDGDFDSPWMTLDALDAGGPAMTPDLDPSLRESLIDEWRGFQTAWRSGDAAATNAAAGKLVTLLPTVNGELYPEQARLSLESWYFRMKNFVWVWVLYALALVPLLLNVVFRWRGARWLGMAMFMVAFALHTGAVLLRWYVAQRWPNSNMFEAVTTAAWFGGCFAVVLEVWLRRTPVRSLFAIGSAAASMVALMSAHFLPLELNAGLSNMMPVLHDVWLYIHTNVIIFSYCLIFIASITAGLYLLYRGWKFLMGQGGKHGAGDFARVGGAASLIMTTPDGGSVLARPKTTIGEVLDGTTMIVLELSFILLWTGLVMGAIWADHSWGRPWGWDPKEVFALNTFIIFALLIHTRMKVRDKGLWTALLAVVGCAVMLFNWIVINFTISGLHSYA